MGHRGRAGQVDAAFRALGSLGRFQLLQGVFLYLSSLGTAYQLFCNIFEGREVKSHQCAPYSNSTSSSDYGVDWNTSHVTYGQCEITVSKDNQSVEYTCLFGQEYGYSKDLSFRTEFDLVCDRKLLGGLVQTLLIMGQGVGAVVSSIFADRFGRKNVLVACQIGLLVSGVGAGFSPSYAVLAVLKFIIGCFQQSVVAISMAITVEMYPGERRAIAMFMGSMSFAIATGSLALLAYPLQHYSWRYLQFAVSASSAVAFFHWWYLDESVRWLVANGRMDAAAKVLKRAARINRKDLTQVLNALDPPANHEGINGVSNGDISKKTPDVAEVTLSPLPQEKQQNVKDTSFVSTTNGDIKNNVQTAPSDVYTIPLTTPEVTQGTPTGKQNSVDEKPGKVTILGVFRNRRLLLNAVIIWIAWFTSAFAFFALYLMSPSLYGDRFVNYVLTSVMKLPPAILIYLFVDRIGRKGSIRPMFALAGVGLISSGLLRHYAVNSTMKTLSVVAAMLGMAGASGMFGGVFFYTPKLFPTNVSQALGISSFAGRLGGMMAPYMTDLADIAVWAPGAIIGSLCFVVVFLMHFLPETIGRELPDTIEDIEGWYRDQGEKGTRTIEEKYIAKPEDSF